MPKNITKGWTYQTLTFDFGVAITAMLFGIIHHSGFYKGGTWESINTEFPQCKPSYLNKEKTRETIELLLHREL